MEVTWDLENKHLRVLPWIFYLKALLRTLCKQTRSRRVSALQNLTRVNTLWLDRRLWTEWKFSQKMWHFCSLCLKYNRKNILAILFLKTWSFWLMLILSPSKYSDLIYIWFYCAVVTAHICVVYVLIQLVWHLGHLKRNWAFWRSQYRSSYIIPKF